MLPVLIIGGGLGGLTLAHALDKHHIPFRLFERDGEKSHRAQGYRISIDAGGASGLKSALRPELFATYEQSCGEAHHPGGRIDGPSGKLVQAGLRGLLGAIGWRALWALGTRYVGRQWERSTWDSWSAWARAWVGNAAPSPLSVQLPQPTNDEYKTDRAVLRTLLLEGLSPHSVTYDAIFTSYTLEGDSAVARFADGTSVAGSLLVGADGTRFRVAEQLIGSAAAPRDLNMRIIYGKTPVTSEVEDALHPALRRGTSFVTDDSGASGRLVLVAEMMRFNHPTAPQDYIFWALAGQNEAIFREDGDGSLLASQAARIATKLTEHWDRSVKIIIQNQSVEHTAALRMTASDFDNGPITWPTERRVTVLGDAVHCMPPTGGQGANSALHDAAVLGELLGREKEAENGWSKEVIRQYEETMRLNIGDVVGMACIGASGLLGVREE